jgi:hypothetical protein
MRLRLRRPPNNGLEAADRNPHGCGEAATGFRSANMRAEGLEPPSSCEHRLLRPACFPFHHARFEASVVVPLHAVRSVSYFDN